MDEKTMFCWQCEQTARGSGCTNGGVCGKSAETARAQDDATSADALTALVLELGRVNGACMALLDAAHRAAFGEPSPVEVPLAVEPGPFVVVTGHDLHDLKALLDATDGTGVSVYTHGALVVAQALAQAFACGVNDLPLSLVLSWYEQKAVAVLLTLLAQGVRGIRLGPTPPAFLSPEILDVLVARFGLRLTGDVDADLAALAG